MPPAKPRTLACHLLHRRSWTETPSNRVTFMRCKKCEATWTKFQEEGAA